MTVSLLHAINLYKKESKPDYYAMNTDVSIFTIMRTYSRIKADGTKETWNEIKDGVWRHWHLFLNRARSQNDLSYAEWLELNSMLDEMYSELGKSFFPAGRTLWAGRGNDKLPHDANFNCSFTGLNTSKAFYEGCVALMVGTGVGGGVHGEYRDGFEVQEANDETFVVEDSREGWGLCNRSYALWCS